MTNQQTDLAVTVDGYTFYLVVDYHFKSGLRSGDYYVPDEPGELVIEDWEVERAEEWGEPISLEEGWAKAIVYADEIKDLMYEEEDLFYDRIDWSDV